MTTPYYSSEDVTIHLGDCLDVLRAMPDACVDAVVTDPPAGISFMGRAWDGDRGGRDQWIAWHAERLAEAARVLKPGGHALVWALPRTSHWTACAIEDAGLEIRDCVTHLFGSGFPKSLDVGKAIDKAAGATREVIGQRDRYLDGRTRRNLGDRNEVFGAGLTANGVADVTAPATPEAARWDGWGTALKPAAEHWSLARKPLAGTVAGNVLEYGTGALNIKACRVEGTAKPFGNGSSRSGGIMGISESRGAWAPTSAGRWPTNVLFSHLPECGPDDSLPCAPGCMVAELDQQSGVLTSGANPTRRNSDKFRDAYGDFKGQTECVPARGADCGGASRFFPAFRYEAKAPASERPKLPDGTAWPTVKPVALMRWLVRLVTPPGGVVLDPFAGTGTTAEAAVIEGLRALLIEQDPTAAALIKARLSKPIAAVLDLGEAL